MQFLPLNMTYILGMLGMLQELRTQLEDNWKTIDSIKVAVLGVCFIL